MLVLQARLETEEAAVLLAAIDAAVPALKSSSPTEKGVTAVTPCARRADALVAVAESFLATGMASRSGGERTMVDLRVDAEALAGGEGICGIAGGGSVSVETAQRLSCDASVVLAVYGLTASRLTWAGAPAPGPPPSEGPRSSATSAVCFPAAPTASSTATTSSTGSKVVRRASTTAAFCVVATTGRCTRAG